MSTAEMSYEPLTPVSFLRRAAVVYGDRLAVVDGDQRFTYAELQERAHRLAGALVPLAEGRPVAVLAPNTHVMLEAHYGVPLAGVPLLALNLRLSAGELAYIVDHAEAGVLVHDAELGDLARAVANELAARGRPLHLVAAGGPDDAYEALLAGAPPTAVPVTDERGLLSLNYTSGTTGKPKGVMYHHRGAYLQALAMVMHTRMDVSSAFLWTLPMFHCNGWCFTWAVTAAGATHVCLRRVEPAEIWRLAREAGVTHFNAAPTVLISLANHPDAAPFDHPVRVATGGAPPSPALLSRLDALGVEVTHLYGLTETFGPAVVCDWRPEWDALDAPARARLKARQGVGNVVSGELRVIGRDGADVPADATTIGEVALRGNNVMAGYLKDPEATRAAAPDGWFRTGDLAVLHPDGYVELRDRAKDVIISGGENIASVEVEQVIAEHPAVLEVAVVGVPDDHWGEVPAAYVTLRPGHEVAPEEITEWVRGRLARFKAPKRVVFGELPKTSTGKIQKFVLRDQAREQAREQAPS